MTKIILKNKKNKGFVLLFAVTISAILLAVALGVANIALKEVKFGTSARDTNDAFFAADTAIESVLFADKLAIFTPPVGGIETRTYTINALGSSGLGCAIVTVKKDNSNSLTITTHIVSKGYNIGDPGPGTCTSSNPSRIEREIVVDY